MKEDSSTSTLLTNIPIRKGRGKRELFYARKNTPKKRLLKAKKLNSRVLNIPLDKCTPMPEVDREYYNHFDYLNLKRLIKNDGYDRSYPIRVLWNKEKGVYEIFDGIHRWKILKELGTFAEIPAIDETEFLTRPQAIAKGIKANQFRAPYNPIDLARSLKLLGERFAKERASPYRPATVSLRDVARLMSMSVSKISQLLRLLDLPKDVQELIGAGKLKSVHARILTRLLGTRYESRISKLAERVVEQDIPSRKLEKIVEAIKHKGYYGEETVCRGCKRVFPDETISKLPLCPHCVGQLRSGKLAESVTERWKNARRKFLKWNHLAEVAFTKKGREIPRKLQRKLEILHHEWRGVP